MSLPPDARDAGREDVVEAREVAMQVRIPLESQRVLRWPRECLPPARAAVLPVQRIENSHAANHLADWRKSKRLERVQPRRIVDRVEEQLH